MTHLFDPHFQAIDSNGAPRSGALLYFYQTATTTPISIYQDSGKVTPHVNPVVADTSGLFAPIYVDTDTYKVVLKTAATVTVQTIDPVYAPLLPSSATPVAFASGTVALPSITFTGDLDTGIYRIGANNIGVTVNGTKILDVSTTGLGVVGTVLAANGTVALPTFSFTADPDTGLYRIGANNVGVAANGAKVLDISATGLGVTGTILGGDGTVSLPGHSFGSDTDTGFYRIGANNIGLALGGAKIWDFTTAAMLPGGNGTINIGSGAFGLNSLYIADAGLLVFNNAIQVRNIGTQLQLIGAASYAPDALLDLSGAAAGQVKFPATQNASANVNTLDDYEEGTWTALLVSSGGSITTQVLNSATRTKVGRNVTVTFDVSITATGTSSGVLTITGVTDAAANTSMGIARETVVTGNAYTVQITGSTIALQRYDNGAQSFANTSRYVGSVSYPAAT